MAHKRIRASKHMGRPNSPERENNIIDNYNQWTESLMKRVGIQPTLVVGLDEFLTVLACLYYATLFFFRLIAPIVLQEFSDLSVPVLYPSGVQPNITAFLTDLQNENEKYRACFSITSVPATSYMDANIDDQLSVYNGHFTPVHSYVFNGSVHFLSTSDEVPDFLIAVPTERGAMTTESLRISIAASVDAICTPSKALRGQKPKAVLAIGRSYASIERAFAEQYGKNALRSVLSVHLEPGVGWSNLQLISLATVTKGQVTYLQNKYISKCKACKQGVGSNFYEWIYAILRQKAFVSPKSVSARQKRIASFSYDESDDRRLIATLTTTGGFKGSEIPVPQVYRWKNSTQETGPFDAIFTGSVTRYLSLQLSDVMLSFGKALLGDRDIGDISLPLLTALGGYFHISYVTLLTFTGLTLALFVYEIKAYHRKNLTILLRHLLVGVVARLLIVALTAAAGYALVQFYPALFHDANALNFIPGQHRSLISAMVIFITGLSMVVWGVLPLAPIPVVILEGALFLLLLQPVFLVLSRVAPGLITVMPQLLQGSFLASLSQLISHKITKRFAKYPSVIYGTSIVGAIILMLPVIYYNLYLLFSSASRLEPIWVFTDETIQATILAIIVTSSLLLTIFFGHVGALMRKAPLRIVTGLLMCVASFVPIYYYCNRIDNDHIIKNLKHISGVPMLPNYQAHIDMVFWCFDNEKACSVDVYNGLYNQVDLYDTIDDEDKETHKTHKISFFGHYVNLTIPTLSSHSISCASGTCKNSKPGDMIVISATLDRKYYYSSSTGIMENISGMVRHVCEQVPLQSEEAVYWRRNYRAYSCYVP